MAATCHHAIGYMSFWSHPERADRVRARGDLSPYSTNLHTIRYVALPSFTSWNPVLGPNSTLINIVFGNVYHLWLTFLPEPGIFLLNCTHAHKYMTYAHPWPTRVHPCYSNCPHVFKKCVMWNWSERDAKTIIAAMFRMKCMQFKFLDGTY